MLLADDVVHSGAESLFLNRNTSRAAAAAAAAVAAADHSLKDTTSATEEALLR